MQQSENAKSKSSPCFSWAFLFLFFIMKHLCSHEYLRAFREREVRNGICLQHVSCIISVLSIYIQYVCMPLQLGSTNLTDFFFLDKSWGLGDIAI